MNFSFCPNISHPDNKKIIDKVGYVEFYRLYYNNNYFIPENYVLEPAITGIAYGPKILKALELPKTEQLFKNQFLKGNKEKFYSELIGLGAGKEQTNILRTWIEKNNPESIEDLKLGILSELSYSTEITTAKNKERDIYEDSAAIAFRDARYEAQSDELWRDKERGNITQEEYLIRQQRIEDDYTGSKITPNSSYYNNLTVAGGTNYTENEISTPQIIPSIKGHAQFSTDNGIGWFRSDVQVVGGDFVPGIPEEYGESITYGGETTKSRRILELQSDLFQKGRDRSDLVSSKTKFNVGDVIKTDRGQFEFRGYKTSLSDGVDFVELKNIKTGEIGVLDLSKFEGRLVQTNNNAAKNSFLQLLNKDNNWVTFFTKSIIQDSQRKGFEEVLFPAGDTAARIEGHQTIADRINNFNSQIESLNNTLKTVDSNSFFIKDPRNTTSKPFKFSEDAEQYIIDYGLYELDAEVIPGFAKHDEIKNKIESLEDQKLELKTQGLQKLAPIAHFYENVVQNILKKNYNIERITDEYGNDWFKVKLDNNSSNQIYYDINPDNSVMNQLFVDIDKFTDYQQKEIINSIKYQLEQAKLEGITDVNSAFDYAKDVFANQLESLQQVNEEEWKPYETMFENILNNWNRFREFTITDLSRIGVKVLENNFNENFDENEDKEDLSYEDDESKFTMTEGNYQRDNYDDSFSFSRSSKDTASAHLKNKLSFIPEVELDNGELVPTENFLFLPTFMSLDKVWSNLLRELSVLEKEQIYPRLQELAKENPMYGEVLNQIYGDPNTSIQNEFIVTFSKQQAQWETIKIGIPDKEGNLTISVFGTNRQGADSVIIETWIDALKGSSLITKDNGEYIINTEKASNLNKEFKEFVKTFDASKGENLDKLQIFLSKAGIDLSDKAIENLSKNGIKDDGIKKNIKGYLESKVSLIFDRLAGNIKEDNDELENKFDLNNPFISEASTINQLARLELRVNPSIIEDSFIAGDGKAKYSYANNSYLSKLFKKFNSEDSLNKFIQEISSTTYAKNSMWLDKLKNDPKFREVFKLTYLDTLGTFQTKQKGKLFKMMSTKEKEYTRIGLFQNQGRGDNSIGKFISLIPSDKTTLPIITTLKTKVVIDTNTFNVRNNEAKEALYTGFVSEYNRILDVQKQQSDPALKDKLIQDYHTGVKAGEKFFIYDKLNGDSDLFDENGKLKLLDAQTLERIVTPKIQSFISDSIKEQIRYWDNLGLFDREKETLPFDKSYKKKLGNYETNAEYNRAFAADYVVNNFLFNLNYTQLISGDPALYGKATVAKTWINYSKRLAKDIAPGLDGNFTNPFYRTIFLKDLKINSRQLADYRKVIGDKAGAYEGLNPADAQEYTTLKEHLAVMRAYGKLTPELEAAGQRLMDGGSDINDIKLILQPMKPVQVGNIANPLMGINTQYYIKTSSFPLVPALTKGLEIDKLRVAMETPDADGNTIDRAVYESGVKLGLQGNIQDISNEDGSINSDIAKNAVTLNRDIFRIQMELPYHEHDNTVNEGSQARKLILSDVYDEDTINLFGKALKGYQAKQLYEGLHVEKMNRAFDKLLKDVGASRENNRLVIQDLSKLQKVLLEEATSRNYNINDVYGLQVETINGKQRFKIPLGFNNSSNRLESILNALVTNRVIKQELPGFSKIQGSSFGFTKIAGIEGLDEVTRNSIVWLNKNDTELNYIRTSDDKKTLLQADILLPSWFKDKEGHLIDISKLINEDGTIDTNKIPEELLTNIGIRIPTQGYNSIMSFKVKGFLPQYVGDLAIVPADVVAQMGSDFDVDKLFHYRYEYTYDGNKFVKVNPNIQFRSKSEIIDKNNYGSFGNKRQYEIFKKGGLEAIIEDLRKIDAEEQKRGDILLEEVDLLQEFEKLNSKENIGNTDANRLLEIYAKLKNSKELNFEYSLNQLNLPNEYIEITSNEDLELSTNISKLSNEQINNAIVQFYEDRYKDVDLLPKILEPNGFGKLKGLSEEIGKLRKIDIQGHFLLPSTQNTVHKSNNDGKAGTGIFSLFSTFTRAAQDAGLSLEFERFIGFKVGDKVLEGFNLASKGLMEQSPSATISYFQSAAVDNAKEQILSNININPTTMDVAGTIALVGFDEEIIAYFLSQPIIVDYVEGMANASDITNPVFSANKEDKVINDLWRKYSGHGLSNEDFKSIREEQSTAVEYDNLDVATMKNNLIAPDRGDQLDYLRHFLKIKSISKSIRAVQSAINIDTAGLGAKFSNLQTKQMQVALLRENTTVLNVDRLFGNNTIGAATSVLNNATELFSQILPYNTREYVNISQSIIEQMGKADQEINSDDLQSIYTAIKSYIYSDADLLDIEDINTERERLLFNTKGNISLGDRWESYSKSPAGKKNLLTQRILVRRGTNTTDAVRLESLNTPAANGSDNNQAMASFYRMYYKGSAEEKELANDIVKYYIVNGGQQSSSSISRYIPYDILEESNFSNKLNEINNGLKTGDYSLYNALEQYFQHNPSKAIAFDTKSPYIKFTDKDNNSFTLDRESPYEVISTKVLGQDRVYLYPSYMSVYDSKLKNFKLFKLAGSNEEQADYIRIDTLGSNGILEYNSGRVQYSLFTNNQSGNITPNTNNTPRYEDSITYTGEVDNTTLEGADIFDSYGDLDTSKKEKRNVFDVKNSINDRPSNSIEDLAEQLNLNTSSLETTLDTIISNPQTEEVSNIAKDLKAITVNYPNIKIDRFIQANVSGRFVDNSIDINLDNILKGNYLNPLQKAQEVILHETLHAITVSKIDNYDNLSETDKKLVDKITILFNKYRRTVNQEDLNKFESIVDKFKTGKTPTEEERTFFIQNKSRFYAVSNVKEFIAAGLTDEKFNKELKNNNFWNQLWDTISNLLGLNKNYNNDYEALYDTTIALAGNNTDTSETSFDFNPNPTSNLATPREQKTEFLSKYRLKDGQSMGLAAFNTVNSSMKANSKYNGIKLDLVYENGKKVLRVYTKSGVPVYDITPEESKPIVTKEEKFVNDTITRLKKLKSKFESSTGYKDNVTQQAKVASIDKRIAELEEDRNVDTVIKDANNKLDEIAQRISTNQLLNKYDISEFENYLTFYQDIKSYISFNEAFEDENKNLDNIEKRSKELLKQLEVNKRALLVDFLNSRIDVDVNIDKLLTSPTLDAGKLESMLQSGAFSSNQIVELLQYTIEDTQLRTNEDFTEQEHSITELIKSFLDKYKNYDILLQKDLTGNNTGRLINKYSQSYYDELAKLKGDKKAYSKFYKANTKVEITEEGKQEWEKDLNEVKELYPQWNIESSHDKAAYTQFYAANNPYSYLADYNKGINRRKGGWDKYITKRPIDKWVDPAYGRLKALPETDPARQLYDILDAEFRPLNRQYENQVNYIPEVGKDLIGYITQGNGKGGFNKITRNIIDSLTTTVETNKSSADIDINGNPHPVIPVYMMSDSLSPDQKSYDLGKILLMVKAQEAALKHKNEVEPYLIMLKEIAQTLPQLVTNNSGEVVLDENDNPLTDSSPLRNANMNDQMRWIIEDYLYNKGSKQSNFINSTKFKRTNTNTRGEEVTTERVVTVSKISDSLSTLTRLKGMGLNPFSGIGNLMFGIISNSVYSGDRTAFGEKESIKALGIMLNAAVPGTSMNKKIGKLMQTYDVLVQTNEIRFGQFKIKQTENPLGDLSWYEFQKRGEYFVQGQTAVAMLLNKKIKNLEGKEFSMFDAYDEEGNWKTNEFGENPINDRKTKLDTIKEIRDVISNIHGDYARGLKIKEHWLGRAMLVFRTWLPQSISNRFGKEYTDIKGVKHKGRYRSFKLQHAAILPFIKDAYKAFNTNKEEDNIDTRNLRKNAIELAFVPVLWAVALMLKSMISGGDDDDKKAMIIALINLSTRAQSDLTFFYNPYSFKSVIREPIPAFKTLMDIYDIGPAVFDALEGNDTYKSGRNKGKSKLYTKLKKAFPIVNQPDKAIAAVSTVVDNK